VIAAVTILMALTAAPVAQRRGARGNDAPLATNMIVDNPDAYYGRSVTLSAGVEKVLSKTAFTIDQRRVAQDGKSVTAIGKDVLVIAPYLSGTLDLKHYLLIRGEVVKFDPAEIARKAKDYKLDLAPDIVSKYQGRPALLATSVITDAYVDLAKKPVPPMSADDVALSAVMKRVGPAVAAVRAAIDKQSADVVSKNAAALKQAFTETEAFFKPRGNGDASGWAHDARQHAELLESNVAAGNWDAVKASTAALGQTCQSCHGAYRERLDDGTYRLKAAGK
jgi:cytochrome c556